jgi:hypothetical protein
MKLSGEVKRRDQSSIQHLVCCDDGDDGLLLSRETTVCDVMIPTSIIIKADDDV